ncbi:hypothetical protein B0H10DRAFT_1234778 [Mycena sp. CBHHK59/15]|nr:hypothetical protein B0H10DRAFT_1234778 [Mycena sp. CBHHK59/15]
MPSTPCSVPFYPSPSFSSITQHELDRNVYWFVRTLQIGHVYTDMYALVFSPFPPLIFCLSDGRDLGLRILDNSIACSYTNMESLAWGIYTWYRLQHHHLREENLPQLPPSTARMLCESARITILRQSRFSHLAPVHPLHPNPHLAQSAPRFVVPPGTPPCVRPWRGSTRWHTHTRDNAIDPTL